MGTYQSRLRDDQVELTRNRILDATIEVMSQGVTELSVPAVARQAEVSVPTIYRHFGNKRGLVKALTERLRQIYVPTAPELPTTPDELADGIEPAFEHHVALPEVVRAAARSELRRQLDRDAPGTRERAKMIRSAYAPVTGGMPKKEREHLHRMAHVLCSSAMLRAFQEHLDSSPKEAAATVAWTLRALSAYAEGKQK